MSPHFSSQIDIRFRRSWAVMLLNPVNRITKIATANNSIPKSQKIIFQRGSSFKIFRGTSIRTFLHGWPLLWSTMAPFNKFEDWFPIPYDAD